MRDKFEVLKQYFGYTEFREGQEAIIDHAVAGKDSLGIMPTGAGKSLCYQVPALMMDGISLVISPLVSLMKDQVGALTQSGVKAAYLNSSLTASQYRKALENARRGEYKIIYVAPERLLVEDFFDFAKEADLSMVTVDEAHCISQWGQDFRPSYMQIPSFLEKLPNRPVLSAFTATATVQVRRDIQSILNLREPLVEVTGFDRPNLYFEVLKPKEKIKTLCSIMEENRGKSAIIYCATRKVVEQVCQSLCDKGYPATRYHAGLSDAERRDNQDAFTKDRRPVMVATNAFGMGIDKSNVSLVVHFNMPKNLEGYYQEAGRAGRDGEAASCILLYSGQDVVTNQFLINSPPQGQDQLSAEARREVQEMDAKRLKQMTFYCHTTDCLRAFLLRYFGEKPPMFCGNCGSCKKNFDEADITVEAQKILSCVKRTGEKYGARLIMDVLRGSKGERVLRLRLDSQSTYGLMADVSESRLRQMITFLELEGFLRVTEDEFPVVKLGEKSGEVLKQRKPISMKIAREAPPKEKEADYPSKPSTYPKPQARQKHTTSAYKDEAANATYNEVLFDILRTVRTDLAAKQNLPAYLIFNNATLKDMCSRLPETDDEFLEVSGVGSAKLLRYGQPFMEAVSKYLQDGKEKQQGKKEDHEEES